MADIKKWCQNQMMEARTKLESGLRQSDSEGEKQELRHALEIYEGLSAELEKMEIGEIEPETEEVHTSARLVCDDCAQRARNYAALLTRLPGEEKELSTLLQKLVAVEDLTVVRLRPYL